jgi:two-component system sensor histidine kinase RpfC
MPVMDGLEALKVYRFTHTTEAAIPVVMLSADVTPEAREQCTQAGAESFIAKPIQAKSLLETLNQVVKDHISEDSENDKGPSTAMDTATRHRNLRSNKSAIDREILRGLEELGGGLEFVASLVHGFIKDTEDLITQLAEAADTPPNSKQFREIAHALKGSAGSVGAYRLYELGGHACKIADRDFALTAPTAVSEIRSSFAETSAALNNYISERESQFSRN